ncbi:hypothetical protein NKV53_02635 [Legionella sp. 27cVA30]|uniref:hypothetical protein n=1 Tax=Legionella sp. 27cVA30 TaxID=2905657 RepID=UPI0020A2246B|nr:hypothetical protein [Legionella sp. 27cVA30]MCP0913265.1 hypothetical protein [Legionella sp. 27cVA30]
MPLPREFYSAGNLSVQTIKPIFFIFLGIIGALIILLGFKQPPTAAQIYYVAGASLLLTTAVYFKLTYYIALELILLAGHGAILLGIGPVLQASLPIMLSLQLLVYYLLSGELRIFRLIGITGIALLSIGFAYADPWIFFFGSLSIAVFAMYNVYQGRHIALLWAILNLVFTFGTAFKIIF